MALFFYVQVNQTFTHTFKTLKQQKINVDQKGHTMKTLIILIASFGLATAVWAGHGHQGPHDGKHHFGNMMFKKMDTDNDGAISVREHEAGLQKMQERRREHFVKMDKDGDGFVTKEEAKEARKEMGKKRQEHRKEKMDR